MSRDMPTIKPNIASRSYKNCVCAWMCHHTVWVFWARKERCTHFCILCTKDGVVIFSKFSFKV